MVDIIGGAKDLILGGGSTAGGTPIEPWKAALLQASLGGVKFNYQSHTRSGGHRVNVIDYPESSQHDLEDMGPTNDSFQVSGYILGASYNTDRNKLIEKLKDSAAKDLVIPSLGTFRVKTTNWSSNETKEEQRIARFNMTFQVKEVVEILVLGDTKQNIFDKKETLLESITDWFEEAYNISQKPISAINNVTATVDKGLDVIRAAKKVTGSIPDFQRAVRELKGRTTALTQNARAMAQDIGGLINFGTDPSNLGTNPDNAGVVSLDTTGNEQRTEAKDLQSKMGSPLVPGAQEPSPLVQKMMTMQAIAAETGLIGVSNFDSPSQALDEERNLIRRYDELLDSITPNDDLYYAIRDAQQAVHEDLQNRVINLPRLVINSNDAERNALEFDYSTHGNLEEYAAFNLRNGIINPAFIPAMVDLQIKVDDNE